MLHLLPVSARFLLRSASLFALSVCVLPSSAYLLTPYLPPPFVAQGALRRALCYISCLPPPNSWSPALASYLFPPFASHLALGTFEFPISNSLRHTSHKARCGAPCAISPASLRQILALSANLLSPSAVLLPPSAAYSHVPPPVSYLYIRRSSISLRWPATSFRRPSTSLPNSLLTIPCIQFPAYGTTRSGFFTFQDFKRSSRAGAPCAIFPTSLR